MEDDQEKIRNGAIIIAINQVLSGYNTDDPIMDPLEAIINSGRLATLVSATSALGIIDGNKFDIYRKLSKLKPLVAKELLRIAEKLDYITIEWNEKVNSPASFKVNNPQQEIIYCLASDIFDSLAPSEIAKILLKLVHFTLVLPYSEYDIKSKLIRLGFDERGINDTILIATELKILTLTKEKENNENLLFNPYAFSENIDDVYNVLRSLSSTEKDNALETIEFVKDNPGVPLPDTFDSKIINLLKKIGMIDISEVITYRDKKNFPTIPQAWGSLSNISKISLSKDIIDDSKLLLNSFRYGQYYSPSIRGQIKDPNLIVNALLRDGAIGQSNPASAIGTDYPLALSRGIVNIVESRIYPGRFSMELRKRNVVEAVRDILRFKSVLPKTEKFSGDELNNSGLFISPAAVRAKTKIPENLQNMAEGLMFELRTLRKKR
jgi:hypothetical protein